MGLGAQRGWVRRDAQAARHGGTGCPVHGAGVRGPPHPSRSRHVLGSGMLQPRTICLSRVILSRSGLERGLAHHRR